MPFGIARSPASGAARFASYQAKIAAGTDYVPAVAVAKLAEMYRKFLTSAEAQAAYTCATKVILDGAGVSIIQYPFYLSFANGMARVVGKLSGEAAAQEAAALVAVWVARGLTELTLTTIRSQVFNVAAPTP